MAYREAVIAACEERGVTAETYATNLIALMKAKKHINVRKKGLQKVDDNIVQFNATSEFGDILGVKAPKEYDLKHTMAAMSDEELQSAFDGSVEEMLNANVQHSITGTPNAETVVEIATTNAEPELAEQPREQATGPADN
jgi:hypothetical protein